VKTSTKLAFVGDVHGNLHALSGIWQALRRHGVQHVVFLGDYINKGPHSAAVLAKLRVLLATGRVTLLAGNHELTLLDAIEREDLSAFLKMGGASTIRSYVGERVGPDVFAEFLSHLTPDHLAMIRDMPRTFETDDLIAQHIPSSSSQKFQISAHVPVGEVPLIQNHAAQLDTGCGAGSGRLTALLWPTLEYFQVNASGTLTAS
jgi:serine/threonine protein phosphatase 1